MEFANHMLREYVNYLKNGFEFSIVETPDIPIRTSTDIYFSSPSFKQMKQDIKGMSQVALCIAGALPTKISLPSEVREIFTTRGSMLLSQIPKTDDPSQIMIFYAKAVRAMGIRNNIYCEVGDIGTCVVKQNTLYSNVSISILNNNMEFMEDSLTINDKSLTINDACRLVTKTNLDSINPEFSLLTTVQRSRILDWLNEPQRRNTFIRYVRDNNVDPEFDHLKKTGWEKFKSALPWVLTLSAGTAALILMIKGLTPTISKSLVREWVVKEVEAAQIGKSVDVPIAIANSPYYGETRFEVKEEVRTRKPLVPRREKHTDTGDARDKLKHLPKDELFRVNNELDKYLASYNGDNYNEYRRLRFNDMIFKNYGIEIDQGEEGYTGPPIGRCDNPYRDFYETIVGKNMVKVSNLSYGIAVFGRVVIVPSHVIARANELYITTTIDGVDKDFDCKCLHVMQGRDLAVLEIVDKTCPLFRDISYHFCEPEDIMKGMHIVTALPRGNGNVTMDNGSLYHITTIPTPYSPEALHMYKDFVEVAVHNRDSRPGDCGSPYLIRRGGKCKILGIHTTGSLTTTTASIVTCDDMKTIFEMLDLHRPDAREEVAEIVFERTMLEEHNEVVPLTRRNYANACINIITPSTENEEEDIFPLSGPRITKIRNISMDASFVRNQKLYGPRLQYSQVCKDLGRPTKVPIIVDHKILSKKEDLLPDGRNIRSQIMTNVNYLQQKLPNNIDPIIRAHLVEELSEYIKHSFPHGLRFLDIDETINGVELADGSKLRSMDMSASSGFFVKQNLGYGAKRDMFNRIVKRNKNGNEIVKYEFAETEHAKCVETFFNFSLDQVKSGNRPPHLFTTTKKNELLHKDKAHKGRVFETPNLEFTMVERAVLGALMASMSKWDPSSPICVGMNTTNNFNELFKLHATYKYHGATDYIKWDKTVPWDLVSIISDAIAKYNTPWSKAACTLLYTLFHSNRAIGNTIYEVEDSMPSGSATTAPLNSLINYTIDLYVFCKLVGKFPIAKISSLLLSSNYGDDKVLSWGEEINDVFDMVKFKEVVEADIGMRMDSDKKDGNIVARTEDLQTLSFLSRTPIYYKGIGWLGALKKESVTASLYWCKPNCDTFDFVQKAWEDALSEAARHGPIFHARLVDCYNSVKTNFHSLSGLSPPASYRSEVAKLFVGATLGVEYMIPSQRLLQKEEAMNPAPNIPMMKAMGENNALARAQGSGAATTRLIAPHMGMSQADIMLGVTPMMNNAQVVDDKNDVTAVSMNAPMLEQMVPERFRFDIWSSLFTSNIFIDRQYIGADTPIDTIIFNYSSDPGSVDFPTASPAIKFVKQLLLAHKYSVTDFRVKTKLVAATGTIGRILIAVVPVDFVIEGNGSGISSALKGSGYDYAEISANGDSTYVASLRPYTNRGFASVSNGNGAGQLVENVRVLAVVSETFGTTFSEQPPNVAITTEFSFGEGFEMSIPLTTFPNLISDLTPPPVPRDMSQNSVLRSNRTLIGSGLTLRVGANRSPVFNTPLKVTNSEQIPEFGGEFTPYLNVNDCQMILRAEKEGVENNASFPIFIRGTLPTLVQPNYEMEIGENLLGYLQRYFLSTGEGIEINTLLNSAGGTSLPITFEQDSVRALFKANGIVMPEGTDQISNDYIFRGMTVRSAFTFATVFWAEFEDTPPVAVTAYSFDADTVPCIKILSTSGAGSNDIIQTGPSFVPSMIYYETINPFNWKAGDASHFWSGARTLNFAPAFSTERDAKIPMVIGTSISNTTTDGTYKPLTLSDTSLSSLATTGTGALPSKAHERMVVTALTNVATTAQFDLVTEDNLLIAHVGVDAGGNVRINIDTPFCYREFSGPIYLTGRANSSTSTIPPTSSSAWQVFTPVFNNRKFGAGKREEAALGMGIAGGILGGIGQGMQADRDHSYDKENARLQYEYQQRLNNSMYDQQNNLAYLNGDIRSGQMGQQFGYDSQLSDQAYNQNAAMSQQNYAQSVMTKGLADPSQLNKIYNPAQIRGSQNSGLHLGPREPAPIATHKPTHPHDTIDNLGNAINDAMHKIDGTTTSESTDNMPKSSSTSTNPFRNGTSEQIEENPFLQKSTKMSTKMRPNSGMLSKFRTGAQAVTKLPGKMGLSSFMKAGPAAAGYEALEMLPLL
jgi:hypothetical protein